MPLQLHSMYTIYSMYNPYTLFQYYVVQYILHNILARYVKITTSKITAKISRISAAQFPCQRICVLYFLPMISSEAYKTTSCNQSYFPSYLGIGTNTDCIQNTYITCARPLSLLQQNKTDLSINSDSMVFQLI